MTGWFIQNSQNAYTCLTVKNLTADLDFSRTSGFRGVLPERLFYHIRCSKVTINDLDFRQNPLKVVKPLKMAVFGTVSWLLNDPDFSRENRRVRFLFL